VIPMIGQKEVAVLDLNSEWHGVKPPNLMKRAGGALAESIIKRWGRALKVLFVCGTGNNGGDGFVAARKLSSKGHSVSVLLIMPPERIGTELAGKAYSLLPADVQVKVLDVDVEVKDLDSFFRDFDVVVDGMLGAGSRGAPRGKYADVIRRFPPPSKVVSIDSPSGLGYQPCVNASLTVTFHDMKYEMMVDGGTSKACGKVEVAGIGIPAEASTHVGPGDLLRFPVVGKDAKKGDSGKVLVIGGGPFVGAPALAAMGALRGGADLVHLAVPRGLGDAVSSFSPDLIVTRLDTNRPYVLGPEVLKELEGLLDRADAIIVGSGAGKDPLTTELLKGVLISCRDSVKRAVVDADGIGALEAAWDWSEPLGDIEGPFLLTPHRGEMTRLLISAGITDNPDILKTPFEHGKARDSRWKGSPEMAVARMVSKTGAVCLVKGPVDLIIGPGKHTLGDSILLKTAGSPVSRRYNVTGAPSMTVGGTGDILAGICAALMARGMGTFDAACLGAYLCGTAGERADRKKGYSLVATDLLEELSIKP